MKRKQDDGGLGVLIIVIVALVLLGKVPSCGGGGGRVSFSRGRDTGHLQAENTRLQEAQRQAAERLAVERRRSSQLVDEIGTRRHVEALMVGVVVLGGCSLAVTVFALARRRRRRA